MYLRKSFLFIIVLIISIFAVSAQQTVNFKGKVTDMYDNPVGGVQVTLSSNENLYLTKDNGSFSIPVPAGKRIDVSFQHMSYVDTTLHIQLRKGADTTFHIVMVISSEVLSGFTVTGSYKDAFTRIDPRASVAMPSPTGDVGALVKSMPGASSTNELSNQYNVRGGNYDENLVFVNDIQIYRPFLVRSAQQEGLSFVNLDLTESVKFSAGGFEAKYGDKMSSVLDVSYKKPTGYHGGFTLSFLGASAHAEGNVNNKFTYLVGARYKTNSYLFRSLETKGTYKPNFFDVQMLLTWKLSDKWSLDFLGNFSKNKYKFIPEDRETNFGTFSTSQRITIYYDGQEVDQYENYLGGLTLTFQPNKRDQFRLIASSYYAKETETYDLQSQYWLSDIEADLGSENDDIANVTDVRGYGTFLEHARNQLTAVVSSLDLRGLHAFPNNKMEWGIKAQNEIINDHIKEWDFFDSSGYTLPCIPTIPGTEVAWNDPARELNFGSYFVADNRINTFRFNAFIQSDWTIDNDGVWSLNSGLRAHYWTFNNEFTVSPRFILSCAPKWQHLWVFRLKAGSYYQPPFYREMRRQDGTLNQSIKSQHSYQVALSADYNFKMWNRPFKLSAETYYKYLTDLISYSIDNVQIIYSAENDAKGYAAGIDVKLSGEFIRGTESWISFSLMKTAEDLLNDYYYDANGKYVEPGYIPRPSDQRFSVNIFFQDHVPYFTPLRVHLNFVFASGLPYGAPNAQRYQQVFRTPWYRRVDVGFSYMFLEENRDRMKHKSAFLRSISNAGLFLEVFNILNINNVSSYLWVTDITNNMIGVPNYLTGRTINLKLAMEF